MTAARDDPVRVDDRRELPFFMVRTAAVRAVAEAVAGPRRVRTIGFYALLCQLANEQRHTGEQRRVRFSYELLATRGGVARSNISAMLRILEDAEVLRKEFHTNPDTGGTISTAHLLIHDGPFIPITVPMAEALARPRDGGHLLRDLGLVLILLGFCASQRHDHDALRAEITRQQIAERAGLSIDRLDHCHEVLEAAGILTVQRRRASNGGRHLPSLYTIHEAPLVQGRETGTAAEQNRTGSTSELNGQGSKSEPSVPQNETGSTAELNGQGGASATPGSVPPSSYAPVGSQAVENCEENSLPNPTSSRTKGEGAHDLRTEEGLCLAFLAAWEPILGPSLGDAYRSGHRTWRAAAGRLIARHTPDRLGDALAQMVEDQYVGASALSLPDLERVADKLIARRRLQARASISAPTALGEHDPDGLSWSAAKQHLERAISRHGRDHRNDALAELVPADPRFAPFIVQVRWATLCEDPLQYSERRYSELWTSLSVPERKESAA